MERTFTSKFSNFVMVVYSKHDFVIVFGSSEPQPIVTEESEGKFKLSIKHTLHFHTLIRMPPSTAKMLLKHLYKNIEAYEEKFGEIKIEKEEGK